MKKYLKFTITFAAAIVALPAFAATLSIPQQQGTINVNETFVVNILLDTTGVAIDGVDISNLNFNPSVLQVVGTQITPGTLMQLTPANTVNNSTGKITFSQVPTGGAHYSGSGILASVTFRAIAIGSSNLTFNFTPGSTVDSNVASNGSDLLTAVVNNSYTISAASSGSGQTETQTQSGDSSSGSSSGSGSSGYNTFQTDDRVRTNSNVQVRTNAGTNYTALCVQKNQAPGTVIGGPVNNTGYIWWHIDYDGGCDGWSVENFLAFLSRPVSVEEPTGAIAEAEPQIEPSGLLAGVGAFFQGIADAIDSIF